MALVGQFLILVVTMLNYMILTGRSAGVAERALVLSGNSRRCVRSLEEGRGGSRKALIKPRRREGGDLQTVS